ncbi:MAG TPA: hypothetical protein VMV95_02345 [Bacillota bacterium]|nr:hypothetical protein [Bacillota bacterium]
MSKKSTETEKERICSQLAIPTKFKLYHGKPESGDHFEFSELCGEVEEIMKGIRIPFMLMSRVVGKYDKNKHLFYAIPYEHAEEIKQKIIDKGLAEKVHTDEY